VNNLKNLLKKRIEEVPEKIIRFIFFQIFLREKTHTYAFKRDQKGFSEKEMNKKNEARVYVIAP